MPASLRTTPPQGAWARVVRARHAQLVSERRGAQRLTETTIRLDRSHERLNQSGQRVSRGHQRRHVATGQETIAAAPIA